MEIILCIAASVILFASLLLIAALLENVEDQKIEKQSFSQKAITYILLIFGISNVILSAALIYYILKPIFHS